MKHLGEKVKRGNKRRSSYPFSLFSLFPFLLFPFKQSFAIVWAVLFVTVGSLSLFPQSVGSTRNYEFKNGRWFDGRGFKKRDFYASDGRLTTKKPRRIDETIDLDGGFVVPPFADAHTHHFDSSYNIDQQTQMYLRDGVFYAAVQTDVRSGAIAVADKVNRPSGVDVSYSHGALTSSFGHGVEIYEGLVLLHRPGAINAEEIKKLRESHVRENDAYYIIDTADDLNQKWPGVLAGKPDFIKIYLLTTEEFEARKKQTDTIGDRGVDPKLVPLIVDKAHAAGLRVSAHVDTVTDYRVALRGGVDMLAHLPGYYVSAQDDPKAYRLTDSDAAETAKRHVTVIISPVAYDSFNPQSRSYDAALTSRTDAVRVHNLTLLRKYKASIAFGSDRYGSTPVDDVLYLSRLGIYSNLEMLKIWCEVTPKLIFPQRKIGQLKEGYEASFLVLTKNPLEDFNNVRTISIRFKQGVLITSK